MTLPRLQIRSRALLMMIACFALVLRGWVTFFSPAGRWHRMIRSDNESAARWDAASRALKGQIPGLGPAEAISALCMALSDSSYRVRETAAASLGGFRGSEARLAFPSLVFALKDADTTVRLRSAQSLGSICCLDDDMRKLALPALVERLNDKSPEVQIAAGFSLTLMDQGEPAIPVVNRSGSPSSKVGTNSPARVDALNLKRLITRRRTFETKFTPEFVAQVRRELRQ